MKKLKVDGANFVMPAMGQGMMGIGGYFESDNSNDDVSVDLLRKGFELGLNFVDTAEIYGAGHAEEILGDAVRDCRTSVKIATKFNPENSSPEGMLNACKRSLDRLKTDYIDLYQTHWPSNATPFEATLDGFNALIEEGLVNYVGLSNVTSGQLKLATRNLPKGRFVSLQQAFNLSDRFAEENLLPTCQNEGRIMIAYSPLMEGRMVPDDERRKVMETLANKTGLSLPQLILSWLVSHKNVAIIPKVSSIKHMKSNIRAVNYEMSPQIFSSIDSLYKTKITEIDISAIEPDSKSNRKVYKTLQEAIDNKYNMNPSPKELSKEFAKGELLRPVKVMINGDSNKPYTLVEGRLRYWAWAIAQGQKSKIDAIII